MQLIFCIEADIDEEDIERVSFDLAEEIHEYFSRNTDEKVEITNFDPLTKSDLQEVYDKKYKEQ